MNKFRFVAIAIVGFAAGGLSVLGALEARNAGDPGGSGAFWKERSPAAVKAESPEAPALALPSLSGLIETVSPSVVYIFTAREIQSPHGGIPFGPFGPFGGPNGPDGDGRFSQRSLGSGFVLTPDGYIVTNNHVVEGTTEIRVQLSDGREFNAELVGRDPQLDLGLIKIEAKDLPVVTLGDSEKLLQGDWVVAMGNPLGLDHSASVGIVSGLARNIGIGRYDALLQTDAAINPGNSGGPLFNLRGEVVGINTAIVGGAQNIGFAIPINMAKGVLPDLREHGKAVRGQLGVHLRPIDEDIRKALELPGTEGALIQRVEPDTPAAKAGLQPGDVIVRFNGTEVEDVKSLQRAVAANRPGSTVELAYVRDGKTRKAKATLVEFPEKGMVAAGPGRQERSETTGQLGISVSEVTPEAMSRLGLKSPSGVLVTRVQPGSVAADAGLQAGDLVVEANREPVTSLDQFTDVVKENRGKPLLLLIERDGASVFLVVSPPKRSSSR